MAFRQDLEEGRCEEFGLPHLHPFDTAEGFGVARTRLSNGKHDGLRSEDRGIQSELGGDDVAADSQGRDDLAVVALVCARGVLPSWGGAVCFGWEGTGLFQSFCQGG